MAEIQKLDILGIPKTRIDYILPFISKEVLISQGYSGQYSHIAIKRGNLLYDDRFSVDFALQLNTPVLASKLGVVFGVINSVSEYYTGYDLLKGLLTPSNIVLLKHLDNTFTVYSHFAKNKIIVRTGEKINQGDIIGMTGLSGWIGNTPHLHFEAYRLPKKFARASFPVIFSDYCSSLYHKDIKNFI